MYAFGVQIFGQWKEPQWPLGPLCLGSMWTSAANPFRGGSCACANEIVG